MKKKDPNEDEFNQDDQENINEADDSFGLPDLDFNTLDEESEKESDETEEETEEVTEPATEDDEVVDEVVEEPETEETETDDQEDDGNDDGEPDEEDSNEETTANDAGTTRTYVPPKPESNAPKLIAALIITVLVSIGIWYFAFYRPQAVVAEKAQMEQLRKDEATKRAAAIKADNERKAAEAERSANESEEAEAAETGTFNIITAATGRYYVVVLSNVDSDRAADKGKEMAENGISTVLLSPADKRALSRLALAGDYGSYMEAQEEANKKKAEFGETIWVFKY